MASGGLAGPKLLRWTLQLAKPQTQNPLIIISPNINLSLRLAKFLTQSHSTFLSPNKNLFLNGSPNLPSPLTQYQTYPHSKYSQLSLTQYQTLPHSKHSSQVNPSHLISSESSKAGNDKVDAKHSLTHLEPECTEVFLSVLGNSDVSS